MGRAVALALWRAISKPPVELVVADLEENPDMPYVKLHGLRHSYASIAVNEGMQVKSLMSQLGHSEIKMTMELYSHAFEDVKRKEVEIINDTFKGVAAELRAQGM